MQSKRRRRLFKFLAILLGSLIGLTIAEICLRIVGYSSPEFYMADARLGYRLIPETEGWYTKEGRSYVKINRAGFNDIEWTLEKPAGALRIAVLGDSYVEAMQVQPQEHFSVSLVETLAGCDSLSDRKVEVLKFGVSGYGTAQEFLLLQSDVMKYSPDVIVLLITTNNDISDNSPELKDQSVPFFRLNGSELVLDNSFVNDRNYVLDDSALRKAGRFFKNNLRFVQAVGRAHLWLKYRLNAWAVENDANSKTDSTQVTTISPIAEPGIDNAIYLEPRDEKWKDAWLVTERVLASMNQVVTMSGSRLVIAIGTNAIQVLPDRTARTLFQKRLGVDDLTYPNRRITEFAERNSIPVIDLEPKLREYAETTGSILHGFKGNLGNGHWNQSGHRIAGEHLGRGLCADLGR